MAAFLLAKVLLLSLVQWLEQVLLATGWCSDAAGLFRGLSHSTPRPWMMNAKALLLMGFY